MHQERASLIWFIITAASRERAEFMPPGSELGLGRQVTSGTWVKWVHRLDRQFSTGWAPQDSVQLP